eukprot:gene26436-34606_t
MANRNKSTNFKLTAIIHSKNNDQEEEAQIHELEALAKTRLRRTTLYRGGARTKIPRIKKPTPLSSSPFQLSGGNSGPLEPKPLDHSIPPGAHFDLYRAVANPTIKSYNDPDRVCINSSSMMEGVHNLHQPPWYFGNNNKIKPPDTNPLTAAGRYGFRGSKDIIQFTTKFHEVPSRTRNEHTPQFLSHGDFVNEWAPPLLLDFATPFTPLADALFGARTIGMQPPLELAGARCSAQRSQGGGGTSRRGTFAEQSAVRPRAREVEARNAPGPRINPPVCARKPESRNRPCHPKPTRPPWPQPGCGWCATRWSGWVAPGPPTAVFTVGKSTARAAREAGFRNVVAASGNGHDLAAIVAGYMASSLKARPILYLAGARRTGVFERTLAGNDIACVTAEIYDMEPVHYTLEQQQTLLVNRAVDAAFFFSRENAKAFFSLDIFGQSNEALRKTLFFCLSRNIAEVIPDAFKDSAVKDLAARPRSAK